MDPVIGVSAVTPVAPLGATDPSGETSSTTGVAGSSFGSLLTGALDNVDRAQSTADSLAVQAATGSLTDVHDYTIAAAQAKLTTELTVAVRDKAVEAFNEIMRMAG